MRRWFIVLVAVQALFLLGEWGWYTARANGGREIVLKARPVDPRSLFMGDYLALQPDIERIRPADVNAEVDPANLRVGDTVYVSLAPDVPFARPMAVSTTRPRSTDNALVTLRGRVAEPYNRKAGSNARIVVDYGIRRFYFPEARQAEVLARTLPRPGRPVVFGVRVSVDPDGRALIRSVDVDGKPLLD